MLPVQPERNIAQPGSDAPPERLAKCSHLEVHSRPSTMESNVYLKTGDYAGEWPNGYHVMLDSDELVTVLWEQVEEVGSPLPDQKYKSPR